MPVTRETKIPLESYIPKERTPTASACRFSTVNEELPIDVENNSPRIGSSQSISPSTVLPISISSSLWSREYISKLTISEPFMGTDLENISFEPCLSDQLTWRVSYSPKLPAAFGAVKMIPD